jgi:ParB family chromosome partitioning protein
MIRIESEHIADQPPRELPIDVLERNPFQPRREFNEEALEELTRSIQRHGILQPLLVRPKGSLYELVAGERRWIAARRAGLKTVPVQIRHIPDGDLLETALIENIQRQDLNPIEEAEAFRRLTNEMGLSQAELATRIGRSQSAISNSLRLLNLPLDVQNLVERGKLPPGQARALLTLRSQEVIATVARQIMEEGLNTRQTEARVRAVTKSQPEKSIDSQKSIQRQKQVSSNVGDLSVQIKAVRDALVTKLATRVRIEKNDVNHQGIIIIEFYSQQDLDRLSTLILGDK